MVDFQKRETRRGVNDPDAEEDGDPESPDAQEDETTHDHHHHDAEPEAVGIAVVTISSSRTIEEDASGDLLISAIEEAGYEVPTRELIPDNRDRIQETVASITSRDDVDAVVSTGGTGITPDDVTPEAIQPLCDKQLPGFGELFRQRSEAEIGTRTIASRAMAGVVDGVPVFCLPGSEDAVKLGISELILPQTAHLVGLAGRTA